MKVRIRLIALGAAAAALSATIAACSYSSAVKAQLDTIADTAGVFALTGAPESGPTAVNTFVPQPVRAVPTENFDVAFDIVGDTQAIALPVHNVYIGASAGIQLSTEPYDALTDAPTVGYNDSVNVNIKAGTVFLIQSFSYGCTTQASTYQRYIYSKFVIDSVHYYPYNEVSAPAGRTIYYRMRNDPNCGFTSLEPGLPTH
jgi:hypothetical protein